MMKLPLFSVSEFRPHSLRQLAHGPDWGQLGLTILPFLIVGLGLVWLISRLIECRRMEIALILPSLAVFVFSPPVLIQAARSWDVELLMVRLLLLCAAAALLRLGVLRSRAAGATGRLTAWLNLIPGIVLLLALWLNLRDF